jgi:hypothetical protein
MSKRVRGVAVAIPIGTSVPLLYIPDDVVRNIISYIPLDEDIYRTLQRVRRCSRRTYALIGVDVVKSVIKLYMDIIAINLVNRGSYYKWYSHINVETTIIKGIDTDTQLVEFLSTNLDKIIDSDIAWNILTGIEMAAVRMDIYKGNSTDIGKVVDVDILKRHNMNQLYYYDPDTQVINKLEKHENLLAVSEITLTVMAQYKKSLPLHKRAVTLTSDTLEGRMDQFFENIKALRKKDDPESYQRFSPTYLPFDSSVHKLQHAVMVIGDDSYHIYSNKEEMVKFRDCLFSTSIWPISIVVDAYRLHEATKNFVSINL